MSENIIEWFKKIQGKIEENPDDALLDGLIAIGGSALTFLTANQIKNSIIGHRRGFISNRLESQDLTMWVRHKLNTFFQKHNFYVVDFPHTPPEIFPEACRTLYKMLKNPEFFSFSLENFFKSPAINALFEMPEGKRIDVRIYNAKNMQLIEEVQETQISVGEFQYYLGNRRYVIEIYDKNNYDDDDILCLFSQLQLDGHISDSFVPFRIIHGEDNIRPLLGMKGGKKNKEKCCDCILIYGIPEDLVRIKLNPKSISNFEKQTNGLRSVIKKYSKDEKIYFLPIEGKSRSALDHGIAQLENTIKYLNKISNSEPDFSALLYLGPSIYNKIVKTEVQKYKKYQNPFVKYYESESDYISSFVKNLNVSIYKNDREIRSEAVKFNYTTIVTFNITNYHEIDSSDIYAKLWNKIKKNNNYLRGKYSY